MPVALHPPQPSGAPLRVATAAQRWGAVTAAVVCGLVLAEGFLPTARSLAEALDTVLPWRQVEYLAFPALAAFFFVSTPHPKGERPWLSWQEALWTLPFPFLISAAYGWWRHADSLFTLIQTPNGQEALLWFAVCIPIGEEFLFRGWLQSLAERFTRGARFSETNPLPTSVWVSAIGFMLWHTQNAAVEGWGFVAFQMVYTLLTGLWLGYLRWGTQRILPCVLAHFALNLAPNL
jgi:membrane protease YdiL (CAAX protease family)